jgi:hypothetical protein
VRTNTYKWLDIFSPQHSAGGKFTVVPAPGGVSIALQTIENELPISVLLGSEDRNVTIYNASLTNDVVNVGFLHPESVRSAI